jgi:hypothetical protein
VRTALAALVGVVVVAASQAQSRSAGPAQPVSMTCPAQLGIGLRSGRVFCDVLIVSEAAGGVILQLPKRTASATLLFDLHTRHIYSAEQERSGSGFVRQTATVVALTLEGQLLARGVVRAEVRREADLFDRITGGAGPSGLKAVAPAGVETIAVDVPVKVNTVSLVGEQLVMTTLTGEEVYTTPGRPVAVVSNAVLEMTHSTSATRKPSRRR